MQIYVFLIPKWDFFLVIIKLITLGMIFKIFVSEIIPQLCNYLQRLMHMLLYILQSTTLEFGEVVKTLKTCISYNCACFILEHNIHLVFMYPVQ